MSAKPTAAPAVVRSTSLGSLKAEPLTCWIGAELTNVSLADAQKAHRDLESRKTTGSSIFVL